MTPPTDQQDVRQDMARWPDRNALAVLALMTAAALATFRDFGLGWDDFTHAQFGQMLLDFYGSGFQDRRAFAFVNLFYYGGAFDMAAALLAKILPFDLFETRRLTGAMVGLLGLFLTWRIGRRLGGPLAGLFALILLAACPMFVGHAMINAKDAPFAVAMALFLLGTIRLAEQYPRPCPTSVTLFGLGLGLALGSRVLAGFGIIAALAALVLIVTVQARREGWPIARSALGGFMLRLAPGVVLGVAVMALIWPWSVIDPLNFFRALEYFSHFFEKPWRELFWGTLIIVVDMPRSYIPSIFGLKLPELFLLLALPGLALMTRSIMNKSLDERRRAALLAVVVVALLPLAVAIATRPAMYNGVRHFIFVLPPMAVAAGLLGARIAAGLAGQGRHLRAAAAAVALALLMLPISDLVRLHPYQYVAFNRFVGGTLGARPLFMLDYWGLSFKQAGAALRTVLAQRQEAKPPGRRWKVATCGPHPPANIGLGPDFETTWEPKEADFALMLGEFYCARLDAPLLLEVEREEIVFARAYDIRGRTFTSLFTLPPVTRDEPKDEPPK